ncbi:MAG: response regulator transcription factor [Kofleriaceae bacterium]|jgi:two-component system nitrate/nitrite response regulator NarL|nr:response regulator transcription factor [Kofleriaceae bacterium]MBP6836106.1 response regulator transcription factor [Kofleriaceae bacterium]MBP9203177.1 response regulator transcription factor [Kofleriaceae bacterium]
MTRNPSLPLTATNLPIRVAVLSEDPLVRASLSTLLGQVGELDVVGADRAAVIVWDAGPDAQRAMGRLGEIRGLPAPTLAVVSDPSQAGPALAAGARGVILRDQIGEGITAALAAVRSGLTVIGAELAGAVVPAAARPAPADPRRPARPLTELTERERQVVQLLAEGLSNKLVADRLGISDHTAKFHVNGVMAKLGASTRTEAVVEAVRRGLVTL